MYNYKMKAASVDAAFFAFANRYSLYKIRITGVYFALKKHPQPSVSSNQPTIANPLKQPLIFHIITSSRRWLMQVEIENWSIGIFSMIFVIIWIVQFIIGKHNVNRMNKGLFKIKKD